MTLPFIALVDAPPTGPDGQPGDPGAIAEALDGAAETSSLVWREVFGHGDFAEFGYKLLADLRFQEYRRKRHVLVLDREPAGLGTSPEGFPLVVATTRLGGTRVIGSTQASLESQENPHLLDGIEITVAEDWRRQGVGAAIQTALEDLARAWGCTTISGFTNHLEPQTGDLVMPAEGPFGVAVDDPATRFAQAHGYHLAQGERYSVQPLPDDLGAFGRPVVAEGYALLDWGGPIDPALAGDVARLMTTFEASMPMGELDYHPQVITAQRVLDGERERHRFNDSLTVVVRHLGSGHLAGLTQLIATPEVPEAIWQGATVVVPEHRGHHLGLAIKLAAMHLARARWPRARRVHTWNAGENDYMWAINQQLGYVTAGVAGAWQKKLS